MTTSPFVQVLGPDQLDGLEDALALFEERTGSRDVALFAQYLHQQGQITHEQLLEIVSIRGRPEVTQVTELRHRLASDVPTQRTYAAMSPEGTYALLGVIGEGSMGQVLIGKDHDLKRKVAFKQIPEAFAEEDGLLQRFLAEAQLTAQLDHPHIVPVYGLEVSLDGKIGYAMKLVEGQTLGEVIEDGHEPLSTRLEHFLKVCEAVSYSHSRGVIHRDLKPENIMVGPFGGVYVMDWGLARLSDAVDAPLAHISGSASPRQTQMGELVGTPAYMSPEQARGENHQVGPGTDQYALGLILQELVTRRPAIDGETADEVLARAAVADRNAPRGAHKELAAVIRRACQADLKRRYGSVDALAEDVRRHLRGEAPKAYREGLFGRTARMLMRYREAVVIALLIAILGVAGVTITSLLALEAQQYRSHIREGQLARALTDVGNQAHAIDAEFQRYERILAGVGAAATLAMTEPMHGTATTYTGVDFDAGLPDDIQLSTKHGMKVSLTSPSFKLAPGVERETVAEIMARMSRLTPFLSHPDVPITWLYVGTEQGIHLSFPGHGGFPEAFDSRRRPWYTLSANKTGDHWGNPYLDVNGTGLTLPCSRSLFDRQGTFLGVAGIDLTFDYVIDHLLIPETLPIESAYLLDESGRVVVDSDQRGARGRGIGENQSLKLEPFEHPAVVDAVLEGRSGYVESRRSLVVFYRLHALGWYYVVVGDAAAILSSEP
jgi:eukaryotic-like serine/threonine-protein kinase